MPAAPLIAGVFTGWELRLVGTRGMCVRGTASRSCFARGTRISPTATPCLVRAEGANFARHHRHDDRGARISWHAGVARHVLLRGVDGVAIRLRIHSAHSYMGALRAEGPTAAQREVARRYVEPLERRDFAALAAFARIHTRFSSRRALSCLVRRLDEHAAPGEHLVLAAAANLQPAFAVYLRAPGEPRYRPLALAVLRVEEGRVVEVVHWDRPELFEAFGLPMSFPPSRRSNEEEVNAKEVR